MDKGRKKGVKNRGIQKVLSESNHNVNLLKRITEKIVLCLTVKLGLYMNFLVI